MDIQRLLRTYIHVNDPKRRNVTIKLAVAAIALATIGLLAATQVGWIGADGTTGSAGPGPAADSGATEDHRDECMTESDFLAWRADHPDAVITEQTTPEPGLICITYEPAP